MEGPLTSDLGSPGRELPQHRRSVRPLRRLLCGVSAPGAQLHLPAPTPAAAALSPGSILAFSVASWAALATLALFRLFCWDG